MFTAWRNDPELGDDVPAIGPPKDENVQSTSRTFTRGGPRLVFVSGEMWRNEWVEPGSRSPRVRRDRVESSIPFIVENDGTTAMGKDFEHAIRWLWFSPSIVNEILRKRGGTLGWFTDETGCIGLPSHSALHFGLNRDGLVNVFAKDIALLPEAAQKLWAAHNVTPEGGVSRELLASQMECNPASTTAPEVEFAKALEKLQEVSSKRYGKPLLRAHPLEKRILSSIHRFQCLDLHGVYRLCKEITRVVTDSIDIDLLKQLRPSDEKGLKSLKRLERLLVEYGADGRQIVGPLAGVYDLRVADAHLPASNLSHALALLEVSDDGKYIQMGKQLIRSVARALFQIAHVIQSGSAGSA